MVMNSRFYTTSNQSHQSFYQEFEHHRLRSGSQQHHNQNNPTPANYNRSDLSSATTNSESVATTCAQAQNGFWHQNGHFPTSSDTHHKNKKHATSVSKSHQKSTTSV